MSKPNENSEQTTNAPDDFDVKEWANNMVIYAKGAEIRTVEQLLNAAGVDQNIWAVVDPYLNKWSTPAKAKSQSLKFEAGRMTGQVEEHGLVVAPMFQVRVKLVRRVPVAVLPMVQPVNCPVYYSPQIKPKPKPIRRMMSFADNQIGFSRDAATGKLTPYHDRACLDLALQVARYVQPDELYIVGDFLDMAEWSDKFAKSPSFYGTTQPAFEEAFFWLRQFRVMLPSTSIVFKMGNHENRLSRALANHLPQACELKPVADHIDLVIPPALSYRNILQLDKLAIASDEQAPGAVEDITPNLGILHGNIIRQVPGATARAYAEKYRQSIIFHHTHRAESVTLPRLHVDGFATAINAGCMCHVDGRVPGSRADNNWSKGFLITEYDSFQSSFTQVPIIGQRAIYGGKVFLANKEAVILDALNEQFGRWNWGPE